MYPVVGALLALVTTSASAQRRVTGRVADAAGAPITSASVVVQGTSIVAVTADDGRYTLNNVPTGAQTLVARRIGYRRTVQILAAGSTPADFTLEAHLLHLEEGGVTGQA